MNQPGAARPAGQRMLFSHLYGVIPVAAWRACLVAAPTELSVVRIEQPYPLGCGAGGVTKPLLNSLSALQTEGDPGRFKCLS